MSDDNPIDLLFGDMEKLGPGDDSHTLHVLRSLPRTQFEVVVDAGCGTGRQTFVLAKQLRSLVHAVDSYEPFLAALQRRAREAGIEPLVDVHCMDMRDIPNVFPRVDLLWSEGAAYNIGFANALSTWATVIAPGGLAVISELCWLSDQPPDVVREFFQAGYPDMKSVRRNSAIAEGAGYRVLDTHVIPGEAWVDGYYDILEPKANAFLNHLQPSVREFAAEIVDEIKVFRVSQDSYGYVFFVLQR